MTNAKMKVLLNKAAETARSMAGLVSNPDTKKRLQSKADKLAQRIKELPCE